MEIPRQQRFNGLDGLGWRQFPQHPAQPGVRLKAFGARCLDERIDHGTGAFARRRGTEQLSAVGIIIGGRLKKIPELKTPEFKTSIKPPEDIKKLTALLKAHAQTVVSIKFAFPDKREGGVSDFDHEKWMDWVGRTLMRRKHILSTLSLTESHSQQAGLPRIIRSFASIIRGISLL